MADKPMVVLVATYSGVEGAETDYEAVMGLHKAGDLGHVAAAVVTKDADGKLKIKRHDTTAKHLAWGGAAVGGLLAVIAPPLGLLALSGEAVAGGVVLGGVGAGIGGVVGHYWKNIPKKDLNELGDALEAGQASLVVVAVDKMGAEVDAVITKADKKIVKRVDDGDIEGAYNEAVKSAGGEVDKAAGA